VPGDSILANSPYVGDGVTSGVRVDLVFRIDPGPGNYSVKGNRGSALVEKDPSHPFWATYRANNGTFGTPGGHGATWNRNVWNSARMDSADNNIYPITSRGIGGPGTPVWAGTLHESDPNFNTLGIAHNLCFLVDPNGSGAGEPGLRRHRPRSLRRGFGHDEGEHQDPAGRLLLARHARRVLPAPFADRSTGVRTAALRHDDGVPAGSREHGLRPGALVELRRPS